MRRLRQRFGEELTVLGIHSAKFTAEQDLEALRQAVMRLGIDHPVVNDPESKLWSLYAVKAWPTVILLDRSGRIAWNRSGEIRAAELIPEIEALLAEGVLPEVETPETRTPLHEARELDRRGPGPGSILAFPSKLLVTDRGLFVADTGHHRILEIELSEDLSRGRVRRVFGSGEAGFQDGPADTAAFHSPRGLALRGSRLHGADSGNHAIRAIDLASPEATVTTLAGTGAMATELSLGGEVPTEVPLRSPWDLLTLGEALLIAMAGSHQLWLLTAEGPIGVFAGTGQEALVDGPRDRAGFNQPSGLAQGMGHLFVADPEASAIRAVTPGEAPNVLTLVGRNLFVWGDRDGAGNEVRLQHPEGLAYGDRLVYIADTFNHKIKSLDPNESRVDTLVGTGEAGHRDGPAHQARLHGPEGLAYAGGRLLIADTNNHALRVADLGAGEVWTVELEDPQKITEIFR